MVVLMEPTRLIVGLTGASGIVYGVRLLQRLREAAVETHLIVSKWAARTLEEETSFTLAQVQQLASHVHPPGDQGAPVSSGSFVTGGMVVVPCSMRTLGAIAHGVGDNLIHRAADVTLKERRPLVLVPRESPLNAIHLENMLKLARLGVVICPPLPAFYPRPRTLDDLIDFTVLRILDQVGIHLDSDRRWSGLTPRDRGRPVLPDVTV
jgi:4-hydroxy-3-polyprenylbenzoate decarboxylase